MCKLVLLVGIVVGVLSGTFVIATIIIIIAVIVLIVLKKKGKQALSYYTD